MTVLGLMHIAWFMSNLLTAWSNAVLEQLFEQVWVYADMSFGFGGLVVGIALIRGAHWARIAGVILCLLAVFSNSLWFIQYYDQGLPRLELTGTAFASALAAIGAYLLLFRWPGENATP
jgi:ABC-type uncharacterized transport system permease subunit